MYSNAVIAKYDRQAKQVLQDFIKVWQRPSSRESKMSGLKTILKSLRNILKDRKYQPIFLNILQCHHCLYLSCNGQTGMQLSNRATRKTKTGKTKQNKNVLSGNHKWWRVKAKGMKIEKKHVYGNITYVINTSDDNKTTGSSRNPLWL